MVKYRKIRKQQLSFHSHIQGFRHILFYEGGEINMLKIAVVGGDLRQCFIAKTLLLISNFE